MKINVLPSDNIFEELGHNTYDYKDLLSELIDNSLAARDGKSVRVHLDLYVDKDQRPHRFVISDDAAGIPAEKLGSAITPAGIKTDGSLNEHGLGMKQAVAALGQLESLVTKTADRELALEITGFRFGEIEVPEKPFDKVSGTTISVRNLKPIVVTNATSYTRSIVPYLGARYRRFLRPDNPILDLTISIRNMDTDDIQYTWPVKEIKPTYFHPSTRENRPVFSKFGIEGSGWRAELTFGYAPKDTSEYEELGVDVPNKFHPYRVSLATQGLDIIFHDRVILFHQLSELGIVNQRHSDYNAVRGEIVLLNGFATAITKNSVILDEHFRDCIAQTTQILTGATEGPNHRKENYIQHKSYPEEIPEALLRDRLMEWLKNNPLQKKAAVSKEYAVEGVEGFIDILADGEAWELKRDQASALDVYQLFMYMDLGDLTKGFLIAKSYTPGAHIAAKAIKEKHQKEVILSPRDQFPINHQPTTQEREDYY
jgi:hypothetical protein